MRTIGAVVLLLCAGGVWAQTFRGSIAGVITDASGAALPGAAVRLESPATGFTRTVAANTEGAYLFPDLAVGSYLVTVGRPGFETKRIDHIDVAVSRTTDLNVQLGVAQQQQVIEVAAAAVTLDTHRVRWLALSIPGRWPICR